MNRGLLQLQISPVQQLMAENPSWWSSNNIIRPPPPTTHQQASASPFLPPPSPTAFFPQFTPTLSSSSSSCSTSSLHPSWHDNQELPESWSQLLLGGSMVGKEEEKEKGDIGQFQIQPKNNKLENWEVKQENSASSYVYGDANQDFHHHATTKPAWSHQIMAAAAASSSSPQSCVTSFSSSMLDFSGNKLTDGRQQPPPDRAFECNSSSTATGGALKKARVQNSATQSTIKVRKEKLGDRITALHQLVSPFGKTDTASVLLEVIGYIRFLHSQIEALSLPYLGSGSGNTGQQQSLLNNNSMKRKEDLDQQDSNEEPKDLRSRGLCLVPVSCTAQVGSDNGADFWAPTLDGRGFR